MVSSMASSVVFHVALKSPLRQGKMTAAVLHSGWTGHDYKAEEEKGSSRADSACQSGWDGGRKSSWQMDVTYLKNIFSTTWQSDTMTRCYCESHTAAAVPSALSINNWFEPAKGSQGRWYLFQVRSGFTNTVEELLNFIVWHSDVPADFGKSVLYGLLCSKWVIVTFQLVKV